MTTVWHKSIYGSSTEVPSLRQFAHQMLSELDVVPFETALDDKNMHLVLPVFPREE